MNIRTALCFQMTLVAEGEVPDWIELIPAPDAEGRLQGEDGRTWRFTNPDAVARNFTRRLPIDINHATELAAPKGGESPAAGWIEELQARNGALWGRVAWTERGTNAVKSRDYRFISPVFVFAKDSGEIVKLTSAALVNNPNLDLALNSAHPELKPMSLKAILTALSLPETASEGEAVNAITSLNARVATPDLAKYVPRADFEALQTRAANTEAALNAMRKADAEKAIDAELDSAIAAGKITPASRDYYKATCAVDGGLEKFRSFIAAQPVIVAPGSAGAGSGTPPGAQTVLTAEQKALCAQMGVKEETFLEELNALHGKKASA